MMMTVKQYADDRQISESTVKRHITKQKLDLPINPLNKKQRLLSRENQHLLDVSIGCQSSTPIAAVEVEVTPYQRSESASMVIAEGEILKAQYLTPYQPTEQNPLLLVLQQQAAEMQQANQARYAQLQQNAQAQTETQQAIAAAKRIRLIESVQQEAFEAHQLKKQLLAQAATELELMDMGLSVNQPPAPTPQPRPQSQPSSQQPSWL